jgi:hypothetical protein
MLNQIGRAAGEFRFPRIMGTRDKIQARQTFAAGKYQPADYAAV